MIYFRLLTTVSLFFYAALLAGQGIVVGYAFDIDDNILRVPTKIVAFENATGKEVELSTAEFAEWRERAKLPSDHYYHRLTVDGNRGSFRYFRDGPENYLMRDLKLGMSQSRSAWQGPVWDAFIRAMQNKDTADQTSLITARGHSPETIMQVLKYLQSLGHIKYLPKLENIWAVSQPKFNEQYKQTFGRVPPDGSADEPSQRKAAVMEEILDGINKTPFSRTSQQRRHTWGFSDDDIKNFEEAKRVLQEGVNKGRWRNVKIVLFYTGLGTPEIPPHAIVLEEGKQPRPATKPEMGEVHETIQKRRGVSAGLKAGSANCETNNQQTQPEGKTDLWGNPQRI